MACIGLAAGSGLYIAAALATGIDWTILALMKPIERRFFARRRKHPRVSLRLHGESALARVETALRIEHVHLLP
ncbi:MAG TPA: hypothetical protein VFG73_05010 [Rhodanobacteraceae bacterium]|nr:hypothetical protein [Rhodanobacteraceae bacterium]